MLFCWSNPAGASLYAVLLEQPCWSIPDLSLRPCTVYGLEHCIALASVLFMALTLALALSLPWPWVCPPPPLPAIILLLIAAP